MISRNQKLAVWFGLLFILAIACSTFGSSNNQSNLQNGNQADVEAIQDNQNTGQSQVIENSNNQSEEAVQESDEDPSEETSGEAEFFQQLNNGVLTLEGITANSQDEDTYGPILTLQLTNPGTEEILVSVPCGLVFTPSDDDNQRLMMVQPLEVALAAGETKSPAPYVVCIDVAASAPSYNDTYSVGYLTDNPNLLKFAECICNKELNTALESMDGVGVQFAAWSIETGGDFSQVLEENGAMSDFVEEEFGDGLDDAVTQFMEMMTLFGDDWLEECEIDLEKSD
jgi:hypothetical protein